MEKRVDADATPQGFGNTKTERLPCPERSAMSGAQHAAADAIINGPRKAIFGPFVPLLQTPVLLEHVGKVGETLRFQGTLPNHVRELAICIVARETGNQFEWQTHAPLAIQAGVPGVAIDGLGEGRRPGGLESEQACVVDFVKELMSRHGVCDQTYVEVVSHLGEAGVVELTALVGYFVMVCWIMNVARTPGAVGSNIPALLPFPR